MSSTAQKFKSLEPAKKAREKLLWRHKQSPPSPTRAEGEI